MNGNDWTHELCGWFKREGRQLPWRETDNPYYILVSEIMLQQTQVATVIPYYLRFIERLPNLEALAGADEDTLHTLWEGLGYYSRVFRLRQFAQVVVDNYNGQIPRDKATLLSLPGIGPYTSGAVLSFAFHQKEVAMDGNVKRVVTRLLADDRDITKVKHTKEWTEWLEGQLPEDIYSFNQGLIELGALCCTPKKPKCEGCPIQSDCQAYAKGVVDQIPNKPKKKKQTVLHVPIFLITDRMKSDWEACRWLFVKRPSEGLLSGLWGLPMIEEDIRGLEDISIGEEVELRGKMSQDMHDTLGLEWEEKVAQHLGTVKHVFSHRIWVQHLLLIEDRHIVKHMEGVEYPEWTWSKEGAISLPTAFKKSLIQGKKGFDGKDKL